MSLSERKRTRVLSERKRTSDLLVRKLSFCPTECCDGDQFEEASFSTKPMCSSSSGASTPGFETGCTRRRPHARSVGEGHGSSGGPRALWVERSAFAIRSNCSSNSALPSSRPGIPSSGATSDTLRVARWRRHVAGRSVASATRPLVRNPAVSRPLRGHPRADREVGYAGRDDDVATLSRELRRKHEEGGRRDRVRWDHLRSRGRTGSLALRGIRRRRRSL